MHKTLEYWSRNMLNFDFLEKGMEVVTPPHFVCNVSKKKCYLCYNLLTDQILLSDFIYFLRYWAMCVLQLFVSLVFFIFLIKPLLYKTKKSMRTTFGWFDYGLFLKVHRYTMVYYIIFNCGSLTKFCLILEDLFRRTSDKS